MVPMMLEAGQILLEIAAVAGGLFSLWKMPRGSGLWRALIWMTVCLCLLKRLLPLLFLFLINGNLPKELWLVFSLPTLLGLIVGLAGIWYLERYLREKRERSYLRIGIALLMIVHGMLQPLAVLRALGEIPGPIIG